MANETVSKQDRAGDAFDGKWPEIEQAFKDGGIPLSRAVARVLFRYGYNAGLQGASEIIKAQS